MERGGDKTAGRRIVVKLGTNLVTVDSGGLDSATLEDLVGQLAGLWRDGSELILVSSGAVGAGSGVLARIGHSEALRRGRRDLRGRQAAAAIGQVVLLSVYQQLFARHGIDVAQALISRNDLNNRTGYLNVRHTLERLLGWQVLPIVNENDVVGAEELAGVVYGDNDRLSAMLANALDADLLLLLGETDGLFTADPSRNPDAVRIPTVSELTAEVWSYAGGPRDERGSGGMRSKLEAAEVAMASGITMVIADGHGQDVVARLAAGESLGTTFLAGYAPRSGRKRWLATGSTEARGSVVLDEGAVAALTRRGVSLLPVGITGVVGDFERGDFVSVLSPDGARVAYGVVNYGAVDVQAIAGRKSDEVREILEDYNGTEVIHRDNLSMASAS